MLTTQTQKARVKYPPLEPKDFGYGPKINAVLTCDGKDIKLWGKPESPIRDLKKGQEVSVTWNGKSYKLADTAVTGQTSSLPPQAAPGDFPARLGKAAANYELSLKAAQALLKRTTGNPVILDPATLSTVNAIARTLYESAR